MVALINKTPFIKFRIKFNLNKYLKTIINYIIPSSLLFLFLSCLNNYPISIIPVSTLSLISMSRILSSTSILPSSNPYKWIHPKLSHTTTLHIIILLNPNFLGHHPSSRACVAVVVPACLHSFMDMSIENPRNRKRTSPPVPIYILYNTWFSKILSFFRSLSAEIHIIPPYTNPAAC